MAQTLKTLHSFSAPEGGNLEFSGTNSDGCLPQSMMVLSAGTLYGTASGGGPSGSGALFRINTDGSGFTNLHSFGFWEGISPSAALTLSGTTLYGTTYEGGAGRGGTLFKLSLDGSGFAVLLHFYPERNPCGTLILLNGALYGTTFDGVDLGTVFKVSTNGSAFTNIYSFSASRATNGYQPWGGLISSGAQLYGTARAGGAVGGGVAFRIGADGSGFTNLHSFSNFLSGPKGSLVMSSNVLYGCTYGEGLGLGSVFSINADGTGFKNLHVFTGTNEGAYPYDGLVLSGGSLYGTTYSGGSSGQGTVFKVNKNGSGFLTLYNFSGGLDGGRPLGGLTADGNALYGTTGKGGELGGGTVFRLSFAPQLSIATSGASLRLTWPTNVAGFEYSGYLLQSATNFPSGPWTTNLPPPVVVNGQYTVTTPITGGHQFFRLSQ